MPQLADPPIADLYKDYPRARTSSGLDYINIADDYCLWLAPRQRRHVEQRQPPWRSIIACRTCLPKIPL